jgi:hypothetical protein
MDFFCKLWLNNMGTFHFFSFWMDELDTDTNKEDAIPSPMRNEGKRGPSSPVDSGISNNPALAKINSYSSIFSQDK